VSVNRHSSEPSRYGPTLVYVPPYVHETLKKAVWTVVETFSHAPSDFNLSSWIQSVVVPGSTLVVKKLRLN